MTTNLAHDSDAPIGPPVDAELEKQRLLTDAAAHGIDGAAALDLADRVAVLTTTASAYRAVDRRIATDYTLEQAEEILLDEIPNPRANGD